MAYSSYPVMHHMGLGTPLRRSYAPTSPGTTTHILQPPAACTKAICCTSTVSFNKLRCQQTTHSCCRDRGTVTGYPFLPDKVPATWAYTNPSKQGVYCSPFSRERNIPGTEVQQLYGERTITDPINMKSQGYSCACYTTAVMMLTSDDF